MDTCQSTPDGTATIYNKDGQPVSTITKPWAYDALGRPQKIWYTVDNNGDIVQHIDPNPMSCTQSSDDIGLGTGRRILPYISLAAADIMVKSARI